MKSRDRRLVFEKTSEEPSTPGPKPRARPGERSSKKTRIQLHKNADMTWHDHLIMLLHIGAEIEHGLMVQYLYAAYSIGGDQIPAQHREMVGRWRDSILAVAKEEMGHLLTVQNILMLLGASINLDREDFPWDIEYYPFPFKLEPLTMDSVSAYVFAEMPQDGKLVIPNTKKLPPRYQQFAEHDLARIKESVKARCPDESVHTVATIYGEIIALLGDERRIPDSAFEDDSYAAQASWDDWGRGYKPDPRMLDAGGNVIEDDAKPSASRREAHVLIERVATRTEALAALRALSGQGEAPHLSADDTGEPSHFDRFLEIYQEFESVEKEGWSPSRAVAVNPTTLKQLDKKNARRQGDRQNTYIESSNARDWAGLFNLRYRMLLAYLSHTFRLARMTRNDEPNIRAMMMHRVFGEMYNVKTIAEILVRLPLDDVAEKPAGAPVAYAGPPFEMPYTLSIPPTELDAWRLHRELLGAADKRAHALLGRDKADREEPGAARRGHAPASRTGHEYLRAMLGIDRQARAWIDNVIAGLDPASATRGSTRGSAAGSTRGRGSPQRSKSGSERSPS